MGEKAVVSSIVAENMGLNVGDVVRVYTTRNFQEISHAYQQTELPMLAEKNARELKDLKEWGKSLKTEGERETADRASVDRAFSLLNGLLSVPRRDAERSSLMDLLAVLNDGEIADTGRVAFRKVRGKNGKLFWTVSRPGQGMRRIWNVSARSRNW